jgi:AcrR family transcriptional regulator
MTGCGGKIKCLLEYDQARQLFQASDSITWEMTGTTLSTKPDRRREAGERTRQRLLEAARALLAERGTEGVTLRDITDAAQANVAAVSYHFGSVGALCRATMQQAMETLVDEQIDRLRALGDDATVEQIAGVLAQPVLKVVGCPTSADQAFLRIMARAVTDPPCELDDWMTATTSRADAELMPRLRRALPGVPDSELRFRRECVAGILYFLGTGGMRAYPHCHTPAELERMLVPVITGALGAGTAA